MKNAALLALGFLEYFLRPEIQRREGGPFNGQVRRRELINNLIAALRPGIIFETGSCRGTSTAFLSGFGIRLKTVDFNPRFCGYCRARFMGSKHVRVFHADSRVFLSKMANDNSNHSLRPLIYLDAHWNSDVPLEGELDIIFKAWDDAIVMIDDFHIPGSDYGYDVYGTTVVGMEIVSRVAPANVEVFIPAYPAGEEGGAKRGWAMISAQPDACAWLLSNPWLLRLERE